MKLLHKGIIGIFGTFIAGDITERYMGNFDTDVQKPIDTVSIIMSSYNEEYAIELASSSSKEQSIIQEYPEYFEFILVDSGSSDKTLDLAEPFVDKIVIAPRGKLTARNIATRQAKGNIIVSTDADTYYPYHMLNTLLKPFNEQSIAGVVGSTLDYSIPNIPGQIHSVVYNIVDRLILHPKQMIGRNSAFWKHLFYLSGRFNENIDQFNIDSMLNEEELGFGNRLSKFGNIIYKLNATCVHLGGRKIACRFGLESRNSCKGYGIGIDRF